LEKGKKTDRETGKIFVIFSAKKEKEGFTPSLM